MTDEQKTWAQVYATILGGLVANTEIHLSWPDLRDRVRIEANHAMTKAKELHETKKPS